MTEQQKKTYKAMYYANHKEEILRASLDYYNRHKAERREYGKRYRAIQKARNESADDQNES